MKTFSGIVLRGLERAKSLGYPTVNIPLSGEITGVYAGRVFGDSKIYYAAVFADPKRKVLEAHILDFSGNWYGKTIEISLEEKIRDSKTFTNDTELRQAIAEDIECVREYFKSY